MASVRKLIPLLDRVLVERLASVTKTAGGVLLPESVQSKAGVPVNPSIQQASKPQQSFHHAPHSNPYIMPPTSPTPRYHPCTCVCR